MINQNFHIHSTLSGCASKNMTVKAIVAKAEECSLSTIAITDHIDNPKTRDHRGRQLIKSYKEIRDEIRPLNLQLFLGCETSQINPNTFSVNDKTANEMGIVLVACNHYHLKYVNKPSITSAINYSNHYLSMVEGALRWKYTNIIAHPFYLHKLKTINHAEVLKNYDRSWLKEILHIAAEKKVAFELCPRHFKNYLDFFTELVSYGQKFGLRFSVGADAHKLEQVCYQDEEIKILRILGLKKEDLFTVNKTNRT